MRTASFIAAALLAIFDFQNLLAWWKGWTLKVGDQPSDDYTIIIPLFGHPRYFTARESLHPIRDRVMVVCETTPPIMADYADELETTGFGVLRVHDPHPSSATLVAAGVRQSASWYTLRLDADTIINPQIACAVQTFADSQADIGSFRIEARNPKTTAARIQAVEYRIAMLSRRYRPWMTSGALLIGKTTSLQHVFDHHSMWTPGEDIETGRAALALGMRIRHINYIAYTDVPETFRALRHQRTLWWAGNFRHMIINLDHNILQLPALTLYFVLGAWVAIYYHAWSILNPTATLHILPILLAIYGLITIITNAQVLSPWMIIFPAYALIQSFVMPPLGAIRYVRLAFERRDLGRYRFGWARARKSPSDRPISS